MRAVNWADEKQNGYDRAAWQKNIKCKKLRENYTK